MDEVVARLRAAGCVFAEEEAALLLAEDPGRLEELVSRRVAGEPLEHLLGWAGFARRRLVVAPGVFVPRRRTELLARLAVRAARATGERPVLVELCCGVAAVASVVADEVPGAVVLAVDDDPAAVACAQANLGRRGTALLGDLDDPLPTGLRGRVDVLVANPPHVPTDEIALMPSEARDHEARSALDGGPDGTVPTRRVVGAATTWLAPGGVLLLEAGRSQAVGLAHRIDGGWHVGGRRVGGWHVGGRHVGGWHVGGRHVGGWGRPGWRSVVHTDQTVQGTVIWTSTEPHQSPRA